MPLREEFLRIVKGNQPILFSGAGCSARANIPTWEGYLEQLAKFAEDYEPEVAILMRRRTAQGAYLVAATLFNRLLSAPPSEKLTALCEPFKQGAYDYKPLLPLAALPFSGVVSTNYDRSLFEAMTEIAAQRSQPQPHMLGTKDIKGAAFISDVFFLFLHGQASLPIQAEHMVFDEHDYRRVYSDGPFYRWSSVASLYADMHVFGFFVSRPRTERDFGTVDIPEREDLSA